MTQSDPIHVILDSAASSWLKDYGAPVSALLVALISNLVLWFKIREDFRKGLQKELIVRSIADLEAKLTQFYDPLLSFLMLNRSVFESLGPRTFPTDIDSRQEAALIWKKAVERIVIPNNAKISNLLLSRSHLLGVESSAAAKSFLVHAASYELFRVQPNAIHRMFPYPEDLLGLIEAERNLIMNKLENQKQTYQGGV